MSALGRGSYSPRVALVVLLGAWTLACSPTPSGPPLGAGGSSSTPTGTGGVGSTGTEQTGTGGIPGLVLTLPDAAAMGGAGGESTEAVETWPPPGYTNVTKVSFGDYALGPSLSDLAGGSGGAGGSSSGACASIKGVVRDFKMGNLQGGHVDFNVPRPMADPGIVTDMLGDDGKPVYATPDGKTLTTSSKDNFDQWYRDVEGVNQSFVVALRFVQNGSVVTFAASLGNKDTDTPDSYYFPVDGAGFNDTARAQDRQQHNFAFTTEIHTTFIYKGGETFTFQGDDDVFVYINKHLAIDLGGIHEQETQTVDLDAQAAALEIEVGKTYDLAVFNAERHTTQSNFRIDTTLEFKDCGTIIF